MEDRHARHHFDTDAATVDATAMITRRRMLAGTGYLAGLPAAAYADEGGGAVGAIVRAPGEAAAGIVGD